ncbi:MAG: protein kinase [Bradymonadales bacterium]|nr:protein kinase [Bradymonadales bacterium]
MEARYCPKCLTLADPQQDRCSSCGEPAPRDGWPLTRPNRYGWLGEEIEGRYRLVQYIGFGSTGEVYRAVSNRIGRSFAVKVIDRRTLPRNFDFDEVAQRLFREVSVLGQIRSPYVVPLVDFIHEEEDLFVLIMDLAMGPTLERMIYDQGWLPVGLSFEIGEQLLEAIGDVHDHGIVHRDLKPENLVVQTLRSGRPFIRLLDFGVAKKQDEPGMTHGFVGTPLFSAPEQFLRAEDVDARCDLYSVGCILFNMLTGKPPYTGQSIIEVMQQHLNAEVRQLTRSTGSDRLDHEINLFFKKAMAKRREERFGSAAEMLSARIFLQVRAVSASDYEERAFDTVDTPFAPATTISGRGTKIKASSEPEPTLTQEDQQEYEVIRVALSSAGDIGVSVTETGSLISHDLLESSVLATQPLPCEGPPVALFFTRNEGVVCVISEDGWAVFYEPRELKLVGAYQLHTDWIRWAGSSSRLEQGAILLSGSELIQLDALGGERAVCKLEEAADLPVTAAAPEGQEGHRLFFEEYHRSLWIRESGGSQARLEYGFEDIPIKIRQVGSVVDVSSRGVLLVENEGQFFEFDRSFNEFRSLTTSSDQHWKDAFWMVEETGIVMLSTKGELYWARRGDRPVLLHPKITGMAISRDRLRIVMADTFGNLLAWQPFVSVVSQPRIERIPSEQTEGLHWDITKSGALLQSLQNNGQTAVFYRLPGHGWSRLDYPVNLGVRRLRWSEHGDGLAVVGENGELHLFHLQKNQHLTYRIEGSMPWHLATVDSARTTCLWYEDGALVCLTVSPRDGKIQTRWRKQLDRPVTALDSTLIASRVIAGYQDGAVEIFDLQFGSRLLSLPNTVGPARDFSFSADGHMFIILRTGGILEVYDSTAGRLAFRETLYHEHVTRVLMDNDGTLIAAGKIGNAIEVYDVQSGGLQTSLDLRRTFTDA